jgi:hypothetical protein
MIERNPTGIPQRASAAYKAGEYLHKNGPQTEEELFAAVKFGTRPGDRARRLQDAIIDGWLTTTPNGLVALTDAARDHFAKPKSRYVGKVALPRQIDVMNRPPYVPPKRVIRDDVPAWSVRAKPSLHRG